MMRTYLPLFISLFLLSSCAAVKQLESEQARNKTLQTENEILMEELQKITSLKSDLEKEKAKNRKRIAAMKNDTAVLGQKFRGEKKKNEDLNKLYDDLVGQNKKLLSSSSAEKQRLLSELEDKKRDLLEIEQELNEERAAMTRLSKELQARERKVQELEDLVSKKDAAINNLKKRIEDALLSFDKEELTVEIRDGKLYVSLSEKLLFKSGSVSVDKKGQDALGKLANVLAKQDDIDILIEGHTDDDPMKSSCIKDNWDLSVLRATSIVRILMKNKNIARERFIASGRSEFVPVAPNETNEGKSKNRRTEIILAPNLDEIFKILDSED